MPRGKLAASIPEGARVLAPRYDANDELQEAVILDNLSAMYYIRFDDGHEDFVFKAQEVRLLEE